MFPFWFKQSHRPSVAVIESRAAVKAFDLESTAEIDGAGSDDVVRGTLASRLDGHFGVQLSAFLTCYLSVHSLIQYPHKTLLVHEIDECILLVRCWTRWRDLVWLMGLCRLGASAAG